MRQRLLIGQLGMIIYSLLAAVLGKTAKTFILAFILLILIQVIINRRGKNPLGQEKVPAEEVLKGNKLFEEKDVRELQMNDKDLLKDMQEQSKFTMYTSLGMFVAMFYFILLWKYIDPLHQFFLQYTSNDRIALFLAFLIYFEGLFVINQLFMFWGIKKVGKVPIVQTPRSYTITDKGIVIGGLVGKSSLLFPLPPGTYVESNERRKFVELIRHGKRSIVRIRFYTRRVRRLEEILKKYGGARSAK
jgi:uncharacterized membrane protein